MSEFMKGLVAARRARAMREAERNDIGERVTAAEDRAGTTLHAGDVVFDPKTGQKGKVIHAETRRILIPPARREGG